MRKRCIRKVWPTLVDTINLAKSGAAITDDDRLAKVHICELASLDRLSRGVGTLKCWHDMAAVNNLAMTLSGMGVGRDEVLPLCNLVEDELIDAARRYKASKRMGLTGLGIQHLRDLIEYHDLQRRSIPRSRYEEAIRLTSARIASGHATIDLCKTLG
jgi:hypothetical protein